MKHRKSIVLLALALCLMLTGCFSQSAAPNEMQLVVAEAYVREENAQALLDGVKTTLPALDGATLHCIYLSDPKTDPMGFSAASVQLMAMMAAKEIDVLLCDSETARRNIASDSFYALDELFTPEQIASFGDAVLDFPILDDNGEETGQRSAVCAVRLSGEEIAALGSEKEVCMLIVSNSPHLDQAKEMFLHLAGQ